MKELPNFVHKKRFSNYFLFDDSEVIMNASFSNRLNQFSKLVGGTNLTIQLDFNENLNSLIKENILEFPNSRFDDFYEKYFSMGVNNLLYYFTLNFHVGDETGEWELYCSNTNEIAIFGCDNKILNEFLNIFKPYEESSIKEKMEWVGQFLKEHHRNDYKEMLKFNYKFS